MIDNSAKKYPLPTEWAEKSIAYVCEHFRFVSYHNPNDIPYPNGGFDHVLFAGNHEIDWNQLSKISGPKAGIFNYDLKNKFERLHSQNQALVSCPESLFFTSELTIRFFDDYVIIEHETPNKIHDEITYNRLNRKPFQIGPIHIRTSKEQYLNNIKKIQRHIREGDIYELNYCISFNADFKELDPVRLFQDLGSKSPMPFSSFFKANQLYLVGASPERFIQRKNDKIIAQPIKGTIKRGKTSEEDKILQNTLRHSEKEKAENLMIVDLMRNDLSKVSATGSIKVDELFGIYPFKQVSQMISTVSSTLKSGVTFEEIIAATFPMGSMTGAPKIKCMELIEKYEDFKRGWFSGTVGYINENGDFDFSVIIRSIIIDTKQKHLYFAAGSAITYDANPEYEYEECLLKAKAIIEVLEQSNL
ncbi:anthranilate synthase component I family protein [Echinicola sp. CAU 1574]|uniref:Anthranilate synthase component I family protein n=1 Tax=Echinicola arenosa TaxID=2774144 RepID=A0ABR9AH18_9BACT|nr:anthranilate synthase component I family protein [Echinicola arenosa]MBD8487607.1 anthranilate synthase component I family protein [Echinicola arenosa]